MRWRCGPTMFTESLSDDLLAVNGQNNHMATIDKNGPGRLTGGSLVGFGNLDDRTRR